MPKYALFFTFTGQSVKALIDKPSDRAAVVRSLAESAGGTLESYYLMFGEHDGFAIIDLPDSSTAAAISLAVSSSGAFHHLATHELIDAGDLGGILEAASALTYTPPGG
jgi:uncharacterized protein with GYD domain